MLKWRFIRTLVVLAIISHGTIYNNYIYCANGTSNGGNKVASGGSQPSGGVPPNANNNESKQGVELDVKKKKTTNQFTYTKSGANNKVHTYEHKDNYAFNKVKFGNSNIWESSDSSQYSNKVIFDESDSKNKTVTLTLLNSSTKKYKESSGKWTEEVSSDGSQQTSSGQKQSSSENGGSGTPSSGDSDQEGSTANPPTTPSENKSSTTPTTPTTQSSPSKPKEAPKQPDKLKISTDGSSNENDATKYTLKQYDKIFKVEFNDDAKCTKIVCNDNTVFQYNEDSHKGKYPKEIYFNSENNKYYIGIFKSAFIPRYGDEWKAESGQDKKVTSSMFKIVIDGSTKENDTDKFDETQEGSFVKCKFKDNVKCNELKYNDQQTWKYEQGNYPKAFYFHKHMKVVLVEFDNDVFVLSRFDYDKDSWESEKLEKEASYDATKLSVVTPSSYTQVGQNSAVIDKKKLGSIIYYIVTQEQGYFTFRYEGKVIISFRKYDNKPEFKEIYFLLDPKKNIVCFDDKCFYFINT